MVGTIGFATDAAVLTLLVQHLDANAYAARLLSFVVAMTVTWALNRAFTFRTAQPMSVREWLQYAALMALGAAINYGVFAAAYAAWPPARHMPWLAVAAGSLAAMFANFFSMRMLFTSPPARSASPPRTAP